MVLSALAGKGLWTQSRRHTLQGMMAVKPGLTGRVPCAEKVSPADVKVAEVREATASGDSEPRKWRQM